MEIHTVENEEDMSLKKYLQLQLKQLKHIVLWCVQRTNIEEKAGTGV